MSSLIYDSFLADLMAGNVTPATDTYYAMLVTSSYAPNKGAHAKRSDVTSESSGGGYTAGGIGVTCTIASDMSTNRETLTFSNPSWPASSITAHAVVIYKHRGGAASADNLVAYVDFGADTTSVNATLSVTFGSPLTIQN